MSENGFDLLTDTEVTIDGAPHMVRFENGMTGIGSRRFWIDGREYQHGGVRQSADLTQGNHALYLIRWRDTPWDLVYIFIHEDEVPWLLSEENAWRKPRRIHLGAR